ncbi:MAG: T9SS type A sorting domain-containing protein [Cytophagales bacterium]|nr:T9SS type A sorting domain-containing protein [Cytophagales bacterium]
MVQKILLLLLLFINQLFACYTHGFGWSGECFAQAIRSMGAAPSVAPDTQYKNYFQEAYLNYPDIPGGLLEAIAYTNTRIRHIIPASPSLPPLTPSPPESENRRIGETENRKTKRFTDSPIHPFTDSVRNSGRRDLGGTALSCTGLPAYYGVMGLVLDGKGYFRNNLELVSNLSGIAVEDIINDPRQNILAYAAAFSSLINSKNIHTANPVDYITIIVELSELHVDSKIARPENSVVNPKEIPRSAIPIGSIPQAGSKATGFRPARNDNTVNDFAINSHIYSVLTLLNDSEFCSAFNIPDHNINLQKVFGKNNYRVLSSKEVMINNNTVTGDDNIQYKIKSPNQPCIDYPGVTWVPADPSNYSSRAGTLISAVVIHDIEGSYAGAISWFQNPAANVSAHYVLRSLDGQITQMVCEVDKGWHVGSENPYTIGLEHEGYAGQPGWYTQVMYQASADLVKDICNDYGINPLRTYSGPACSGSSSSCLLGGCIKIKGHQHYPNQTHTDPGIYWDWKYFYQLINDSMVVTTYTASSDTFYDSGGPASNYADDERSFWLISPAGAASVTLTYLSFDLETDWDYLYIYDGTTVDDPLTGVYTGTNSPGTITAQSGSFLIEFRSDCNTNNPGWEAAWTSDTIPLACPLPTNLTESNMAAFTTDLTWDTVAGALGYLLKYKRNLDASWTYVNVSSNNYTLTGLASNAIYYWQVSTLCVADSSGFGGSSFNTPAAQSQTTTLCSGLFRDSGGELGTYFNNEDHLFTISPAGAASITVSFTFFDIELNWDYLYIHDGPGTASPQIPGSPFTGTNSPGTIVSSGGDITFRFTSDGSAVNPGWDAIWSCNLDSVDFLPPATSISNPGFFETTDFMATFTDADNPGGSGLDLQFYQALDLNGVEWRANDNNGFFNDHFDIAIHPDWTDTAGIWVINSGAIHQTDESQGNTNIYASLAQGSTQIYLYHWQANMNGSGVNRRSGIHFFSDDGSLPNRGNSYFVYYRVDQDKCQIYKVTNDTWAIQTNDPCILDPGVWYDFKVIFNPATGEIKGYRDDQLVSSWIDPSPYSTGSYISLRTGNANVMYDDLKVYKVRANSELITLGSAAANDIRFQNAGPATPSCKIVSIVKDSAENWSAPAGLSVNIDWTTPADIAAINDGAAADIDTTYIAGELTANWAPSTDTNSGIAKYRYAIGTMPGDSDIVGWTDNGIVTLTDTGLTLIVGQSYYFSVKAENGAGLLSNITSSDGQVFQNPTAINEFRVSGFGLRVYPNPFDESITISYRLNEPGHIVLNIFDLPGKKIAILVDQYQFAGDHMIELDDNVVKMMKGVYVLKLSNGVSSGYVKLIKH